MTKGLRTCAVVALLLSVPVVVCGWNFDYEIYSQSGGMLHSEPTYDGILTGGGEGTLSIWFNDSGWPVDPQERFDSLWAWYFADNYNDLTPGAEKWVGQIPGRFAMEVTNGPVGYSGTCEGSINAKITVRDWNANATLDEWEWKDKQHLFDGRLSKSCEDPSTGEMALKWGWGALASNYFSFEATPVDTLYNGGNLTLMTGCTTATEPASWGSIKALYK